MKVSRYRFIHLYIFIFSFCFIFSCNKESSDLEVSRGSIISDKDYPSVVHLYTDNVGWCTGSIISSNTILTAAHCTADSTGGTDKHRVYKNNINYFKVDKTKINPMYQYSKDIVGEAKKENAKSDIAVWILSGKPFTNYSKKLQISNIDPNKIDKVRFVGWGCYTKLEKKEEVIRNGQPYRKYVLYCDKDRRSEKRTGVNNRIDIVSEDKSYVKLYSSDDSVDKIENMKQNATGENVMASPGDSGGPLLIENQSTKIIGVSSLVSSSLLDRDLCTWNPNLTENSEAWRDCWNLFSIYINPVSSYNISFLEKMVDENKAIIPGVQVGVRVIEYDGKIKVLYKEEKTSFSENVVEHKVISKFNNDSYKTVKDLKKAWRATNFYDRSKAQWSFE